MPVATESQRVLGLTRLRGGWLWQRAQAHLCMCIDLALCIRVVILIYRGCNDLIIGSVCHKELCTYKSTWKKTGLLWYDVSWRFWLRSMHVCVCIFYSYMLYYYYNSIILIPLLLLLYLLIYHVSSRDFINVGRISLTAVAVSRQKELKTQQKYLLNISLLWEVSVSLLQAF